MHVHRQTHARIHARTHARAYGHTDIQEADRRTGTCALKRTQAYVHTQTN